MEDLPGQAAVHFGMGMPFAYAAGACVLFAWLDQNVSNEAKAAFPRFALLSVIFIPGFLLHFAGASAQEPQARGRDLNSIVSDGVLRVAMTRFDLPGFHTTSPDSSVNGLEADVAREIARALDVRAVFKADYGSFDAVAEAVASGQADIGISKLSQTYYRVTHVLFSEPYVTLRHALLYDRIAVAEAAQGGSPEDALRNFRGRIAVIGKSAYEDFGDAQDHRSSGHSSTCTTSAC